MKLVYLNHEEFDIETASFEPFVSRLNLSIEVGEGILNVVFVSDDYIQALNKAYRGQDKPTDVLSFNYEASEQDSGDAEEDLLGEVYVSVPTAQRQAQEHDLSLPDELIKLIIHGILHVHGYDHEEDEDYREMYAIEKQVLGSIAGEFLG